ncbi:MAG: PAAR-like domain-containing protein [Nannocystaceae bacterium]
MGSIAVNPPRTPVTEGSSGVAMATIPNICKMPGPPAPFVPTPLPNIGKSGSSPKGYSKKVKFEGKKVAIRGASFESMGDAASKGTGGGLVSANTHGPTKFIGPGSLNVKVEGKNVQYLGDPMMNNCGPSGSPANSATLAGVLQAPAVALPVLEFDSADFPEKTENMKNGMNGQDEMVLTRQEGKSVIRRTRRAALKGKKKGGAGTSLDEFPFASCKQGGKGASVEPIPKKQQCQQGGKMSGFYRKHNIKDGDSFIVRIT